MFLKLVYIIKGKTLLSRKGPRIVAVEHGISCVKTAFLNGKTNVFNGLLKAVSKLPLSSQSILFLGYLFGFHGKVGRVFFSFLKAVFKGLVKHLLQNCLRIRRNSECHSKGKGESRQHGKGFPAVAGKTP